jgi:hypothetical protein
VASLITAAVLGLSSVGHAETYTVPINVPMTIVNTVAVEKDSLGTLYFTKGLSLTGPAVHTITTPNTGMSSYYILASFLHPDNSGHMFVTMNEPSALASVGTKFSIVFAYPDGTPRPEATITNAVNDFATGDAAAAAAALNVLTTFSQQQGTKLFTNVGTQAVSMQFTAGVVVSVIPVPAAVSQGALLLGLIAGAGALKRVARRRTAADLYPQNS